MFRVFCTAITLYLSGSIAFSAVSPNVVVFLVDDARVDDLTTMPIARSIATAGAKFQNAYSPFPLCCPARATLLTGQYAHNHGVQSNKRPTGGFWAFRDDKSLATWLDPTYVTGWTGKYFNEYGTDGSGTYIPPGWDEWFTPDGSVWNYAATRWNRNGVLKTFPGQYQTDTLANFAVNFVNQYAGGPEPFFLVASFLAPHAGSPSESDDPSFPTPYVAPRHKNALSGLPLTFNPAFNEDNSDKPVRPGPLQSWEINALTEVNQQRRESLLSVEEAMQRILQTLTNTGVIDNTYIIFVSDNGYALGEHRYRGGKVMPYDVAAKIPLFIRGPGIAAGRTVVQPVGIQDLAPSILAMTSRIGAQGSFVMDGLNLLPMFNDPLYYANRPIVLEGAPPNGELAPDWLYQGIVTPNWKFVERATGAAELYDRVNDPWELQNRAKNTNFAQPLAEMKQLKNRLRFCQGAACLQ